MKVKPNPVPRDDEVIHAIRGTVAPEERRAIPDVGPGRPAVLAPRPTAGSGTVPSQRNLAERRRRAVRAMKRRPSSRSRVRAAIARRRLRRPSTTPAFHAPVRTSRVTETSATAEQLPDADGEARIRGPREHAFQVRFDAIVLLEAPTEERDEDAVDLWVVRSLDRVLADRAYVRSPEFVPLGFDVSCGA